MLKSTYNGDVNMNILVTFDNNYVDAALDMLFSIKLYNDNLIIHILYDNLSEESINRVRNFVEINKIGQLKLHYYETKNKDLSVIKTDYITKSCYLRLYAPYLIEADRLLYLDPDIVCQGSLEELYNVDLGDNIIAACQNMLREDVEFLRAMMLKELNLPEDADYINSGVLLIDTEKYKDYLSLHQLEKYLKENSDYLEYHDQDAINYLCQNKIKIMDNIYNYQINATDWWKLNYANILVHYSEAAKPWKLDYDDPAKAMPYYELLHAKGEDDRLRKLLYSHAKNNAELRYNYIVDDKTKR